MARSMFPPMDAERCGGAAAGVSDDIRAAVIFERGEPSPSHLPEEEAAELAALGDAMLASAARFANDAAVRQLEAVTPEGGVYVAGTGERGGHRDRRAGSLVGLVQHDLRTLLSSRVPASGSQRRRLPAP